MALNGSHNSGRDVVEWAREVEQRGAGEIFLTSIDRDGTGVGYDLESPAQRRRRGFDPGYRLRRGRRVPASDRRHRAGRRIGGVGGEHLPLHRQRAGQGKATHDKQRRVGADVELLVERVPAEFDERVQKGISGRRGRNPRAIRFLRLARSHLLQAVHASDHAAAHPLHARGHLQRLHAREREEGYRLVGAGGAVPADGSKKR